MAMGKSRGKKNLNVTCVSLEYRKKSNQPLKTGWAGFDDRGVIGTVLCRKEREKFRNGTERIDEEGDRRVKVEGSTSSIRNFPV